MYRKYLELTVLNIAEPMELYGLDEAGTVIKIARKNINNVRYADMTPHLWQKAKKS